MEQAIGGAVVALITGILGLVGTRILAGVQRQAAKNEERLRQYEAFDRLLDDLRTDYERMRGERERIRAERDRARMERDDALKELAEIDRKHLADVARMEATIVSLLAGKEPK